MYVRVTIAKRQATPPEAYNKADDVSFCTA